MSQLHFDPAKAGSPCLCSCSYAQLALCTYPQLHSCTNMQAVGVLLPQRLVLGNVVFEGVDYQCRHVGVALERHQFHLVV